MVRYEAYMLVDLLPPFLKTYGHAVDHLDHGRRLSDGTSAARLEMGELQRLTRKLNALQVALVFTVPLCGQDMYKRQPTFRQSCFLAGTRRAVFACAR